MFDSRFSAAVENGQIGEFQIILDGRRSSASLIVSSYLQEIVRNVAAEARPAGNPGQPTRTVITNWFNPALIYLWFVMPALLVTLGATGTLAITAQSVARERELGTFEQLMV